MKNYESKIYEYYNSVSNKGIDSSRAIFFQQIIKKYLPKNRSISICELGAGSGQFQAVLTKNGYENSFGIDASKEQVLLAKSLNLDVREENIFDFINESINNNIKYDVIVAIDVFEHFDKESFFELINLLKAVLTDDGFVLSHQPNAESPFFGNIRYGDFTHYNAFTSTSIKQVFLANGFKRVHSYEDKPIVHGLKSKIRYLLWEYLVRKVYSFLITVETGGAKGKIFSQNFITVAHK